MKKYLPDRFQESICSCVTIKLKYLILLGFFILIATIQANAGNGSHKTVSLTANKISLEKMFFLLKKQTGYSFFYTTRDMAKANKITVAVKHVSIEEALNKTLVNQGYAYSINGKIITISFAGVSQPNNLTAISQTTFKAMDEFFGRVTNEKGEPMAGVSVKIIKTNLATITNESGYFRLSAHEKDTVEFSFVGYESQRIVLKQKVAIEISLKPIAKIVEDVIVVGYGKQKKASVVGAISSISPEALIIPSSQLSNSFAGRISGIIAVQSTGEPGKDAASFWIRGIATNGSTTPLIFLDGIEISVGDLNSVDPVNIENFSILKDASATALYGARGANGVILISSKRGKIAETPNISVLVETSFVSPTMLPSMADGLTYMKAYNEARFNNNPFAAPMYSDDKINGTAKKLDPYIYPDVDWYHSLFTDVALRQHANLNIRGGGKNARYYMGGSYYRDNGILKNLSNNPFNFNSNILNQRYNFVNNMNVNVTKSTEVELNISADYVRYSGPANSAASIFDEVMQSNPVHFPVMFPPDSNVATTSIIKFGNATGGILANTSFYNPYADMVLGYTQHFYSTVLSTIRLNQKLDFITKGLSANVLASFKNYSYSSITRRYTPYYYQLTSYSYDSTKKNYNYKLNMLGNGGTTSLSQSGGSDGDRTLYMQALLNYDRSFGTKHAITGLLVYQQKQFDGNSPGGDITASLPHRNQGISGRATYSYDNRYFIEGNFGYTGSENFAEGHRYGFFPSIGAGYIVSNEKYFENLYKLFSLFKIRASYGLAGNDALPGGRFPYLSKVNLEAEHGAVFGLNFNNSRNRIVITQYPNVDITWEVAHKLDIGLDLEILHALTLNIDFFQEKRDHIFQQRATIPSTVGTGSASLFTNFIKVENRGVDVTAVYNRSVSKDFIINGRGTFSFARNKILAIDEPHYIYPYLSDIGKPVNTLRGLIADRLFIDTKDIAISPAQKFSVVNPGDIKYINQTGSYTSSTANTINSNDMLPMGYPSVPEITYGFGVDVIYKKVDVGIFFQGIANTSFFMNGIVPFNRGGGMNQCNLYQFIADDHWSPSNQNLHALYPRLSEINNQNNEQNSSWWLRNGSFLRLKNMEIGYTPTKILRIYLSGSDLLTFSGFKLWDPEVSANESSDNGQSYPPERVFNVGIQLNLK